MKTTISKLNPGDRIRVRRNRDLFDTAEMALHRIDPDGIHLTADGHVASIARVLATRSTGDNTSYPMYVVETSMGTLDVLGTQPVVLAAGTRHEIRRAWADALTEDRVRRTAAAGDALDAMIAADEAENRTPAWA